MNEDTKFLIQRMDSMKTEILEEFKELSKKIEGHDALKNKLYGISLVLGALGSLIVSTIVKHI